MDYGDGKERLWVVKASRGLSQACRRINRACCVPSCGPLAEAPTIVSRTEWGARSLACRAQLNPPVAYVIMDQLIGMECQEQDFCSQRLWGLQFHSVYTKVWCDVAYK